jgi:hypothetical protein
MKTKVMVNGVEQWIDTEDIKVGETTLGQLLTKITTLQNNYIRLTDQLSKREQAVQKAVKKL